MEQHRFDAVSFVFGVIFAALGITFMVAPEPWRLLAGLSYGWLWAAALIALGLALVLPALRGQDRAARPAVETAAEEDLGEALEELPPPPID
ncbi:MAG: hypothetical protein R6X29_11555 [Acidimicrobiia bacterium]|jgi:hypothetical protein